MALARDLGAEFDTVERELGFDPFRNAERIVMAIYAPPGDSAAAGWPLLYARGTFDRASLLARARQRPEAHGEQTEGTEEGIAYTTVGQRAYMFPAVDVMLVMDRGLVRRVAARLAGATDRTVLTDDRFTDLWREARGMDGVFAIAADLAAMRSRVRIEGNPPEVEALERVVAHGDAPGAVSLRAAGRARNAAAAQQVVHTIDEARLDVAGQIPVRLLGLSRVLREGITTSADGDVVRASVDATADEARRLVRATSLMREFMGR
jgi:hypothetical protein